mmetsp:Transcript_4674/g.19030  ORF Transcript_4674/g.19030 Transcript_4674/m.19030 type:complete len:293 (-) Transcript_4674:289-1167(-)
MVRTSSTSRARTSAMYASRSGDSASSMRRRFCSRSEDDDDDPDDAWGCCPMLNATLYCADPDTACPQPSALSDPATNPVCAECFAGGDPYAADVNPSCKVIDQAMWPVHCTDPAEGGDGGFAEGLVPRDDDVIMQKGTLAALDAYSVFQDNAFFSLRGGVKAGYAFEMAALLESEGIEEFYVTGLATDFCVSWSAKDAAALGYTVYMIDDAAAGIANETTLAEYALMEAANVTILEYFGGPELEYRRRLAEAESVRRARELRDAGIARISMTDLRAKIDAEKTTTARRRLRG